MDSVPFSRLKNLPFAADSRRQRKCAASGAWLGETADRSGIHMHLPGNSVDSLNTTCSPLLINTVLHLKAYPTGEGIVVQMGAYDEVYESQYGQFERSYGELKYTKAEEKKEEKKKGLFGW